jgi:hypothetical protein
MTAPTSSPSPIETQLRAILSRRIMILDGAMGTIIQQYKLDESAYRGGPEGRFATFSAPENSGTRELFVKGNNELLTLTQHARQAAFRGRRPRPDPEDRLDFAGRERPGGAQHYLRSIG